MQCAQKQGIAPLNHILQQTGLTPQDIENLSNQMMSLFENMDADSIEEAFSDSDEGRSSQLLRPFSGMISDEKTAGDDDKKTGNYDGVKIKTKKQGKRKYLDTYGINLTEKAARVKLTGLSAASVR